MKFKMIDIGGPYKVLEPGEHLATLSQIEVTFATNEHREWLFEGFKRGVKVFRKAGLNSIVAVLSEADTAGMNRTVSLSKR